VHQKFIQNSDILYIEKTDSWSSHSIIYEWLSNYQSGTKILEIGAASGTLGNKFEGFGFYLKGLEPVKEWAEEAQPFYNEFICSSLGEASDEFLEKQDVVVFADVLEHTSNPKELLKRLVELQKPHTQFLISVPNVAYIWIRLNLLIGKFNYTDFGILDRTHLRFFTKHTFFEMLRLSGLNPIELKYTPAPLSRVNPFFQKHPIGRLVQRIFAILAIILPGLFAYQFVARLEISHVEAQLKV